MPLQSNWSQGHCSSPLTPQSVGDVISRLRCISRLHKAAPVVFEQCCRGIHTDWKCVEQCDAWRNCSVDACANHVSAKHHALASARLGNNGDIANMLYRISCNFLPCIRIGFDAAAQRPWGNHRVIAPRGAKLIKARNFSFTEREAPRNKTNNETRSIPCGKSRPTCDYLTRSSPSLIWYPSRTD